MSGLSKDQLCPSESPEMWFLADILLSLLQSPLCLDATHTAPRPPRQVLIASLQSCLHQPRRKEVLFLFLLRPWYRSSTYRAQARPSSHCSLEGGIGYSPWPSSSWDLAERVNVPVENGFHEQKKGSVDSGEATHNCV